MPPTTATSTPAATASPAAPAALDAFDGPAAEGGDVACPLCRYNLRGLSEPRCPECGYRFTWRELTDPEIRRHPYLFEHHPRRNAWSFARTLSGGLLPRSFWSSLKPTQPSRPGRLVLYWCLATLPLVAGYLVLAGDSFVKAAQRQNVARAAQLQGVKQSLTQAGAWRQPWARRLAQDVQRAGSPEAFVDQIYPPPLNWRFVVGTWLPSYDGGPYTQVAVAYVAWPWLTFATLMLFRASMARAKVRTIHVLRCALYACDAGMWLGPLAMLAGLMVARAVPLTMPSASTPGLRALLLVAAPLFALVTWYRLRSAYALYLRFDRPGATALAAQMIVLLVMVVLALNV
jgi:hypothetical protein